MSYEDTDEFFFIEGEFKIHSSTRHPILNVNNGTREVRNLKARQRNAIPPSLGNGQKILDM